MSTQHELKIINTLLEEASEHGLEAEVILYALRAMKEDNTLTPVIAFKYGHEEWIK
jgi:hypothetical protein